MERETMDHMEERLRRLGRAPMPFSSRTIGALAIAGLLMVGCRNPSAEHISSEPTSAGTETVAVTFAPTRTPTSIPTSEPTAAPRPDVPPPDAERGDLWTRPKDVATMVYVPGGSFDMGDETDYGNSLPVHTVALEGFWIDQTEVTTIQFAQFVNERGNQTEGGAPWLAVEGGLCRIEQVDGAFRPEEGYAEHPTTHVTWYGAAAYCEWAGGRLATEAEWEYAARGREGRTYPWGEGYPDQLRANFCDVRCEHGYKDPSVNDGYKQTAPVGSFPAGASWCGALDMAGNAWEWVNDWYDGDFYSRSPRENPTGPEWGDSRVMRGGSWVNRAPDLVSAERVGVNPDATAGLRCAKDSQSE